MIRTKFNSGILFLVCCLTAFIAAGQTTSVKVSADKNKILIGEPLRLTFEVVVPANEAIRFFQVDSIPHFEFLAKEKIDTVNTSSGTVLTQVIQITSFDSGHWVIPAFVLTDELVTDSIPVDVGYSDFDPKQPYHDVKDIIEVTPAEEKKTNWWYYAAGGLAVAIALIYLLSRKKKVVVKPAAAAIDPYENAMLQLKKINEQKPATKIYYSALVDIFRVYIQERKNIHSLQNTTDDLVIQLRSLQLPAAQAEALSGALRLSDFVKFAKYIPEEKDDAFVFETIKNAIISIEKTNTAAPVVN